jgi:hypothetical protein
MAIAPVRFHRIALSHGNSRGFGFIDFDSAIDAARVQRALNNTVVDGITIRLSFGNPCKSGEQILGGPPPPPKRKVTSRSSSSASISSISSVSSADLNNNNIISSNSNNGNGGGSMGSMGINMGSNSTISMHRPTGYGAEPALFRRSSSFLLNNPPAPQQQQHQQQHQQHHQFYPPPPQQYHSMHHQQQHQQQHQQLYPQQQPQQQSSFHQPYAGQPTGYACQVPLRTLLPASQVTLDRKRKADEPGGRARDPAQTPPRPVG